MIPVLSLSLSFFFPLVVVPFGRYPQSLHHHISILLPDVMNTPDLVRFSILLLKLTLGTICIALIGVLVFNSYAWFSFFLFRIPLAHIDILPSYLPTYLPSLTSPHLFLFLSRVPIAHLDYYQNIRCYLSRKHYKNTTYASLYSVYLYVYVVRSRRVSSDPVCRSHAGFE